MAIVYFGYLLDSDSLLSELSPVVPQAAKGDFQPLFELSNRTMIDRPELWKILENWFLGPPADDEEDDLTPGEALTRICTQFLEPIFEKPFAWRTLRLGLSTLGWTEYDIHLLLYGKSLCDLVLNKLSPSTLHRVAYHDEAIWCDTHLGWLDLRTVRELTQKLLKTQEAYEKLSKNPQAMINKIPAKQKLSSEYYSLVLRQEYSEIMKILTTAIDADKSIVMTEA